MDDDFNYGDYGSSIASDAFSRLAADYTPPQSNYMANGGMDPRIQAYANQPYVNAFAGAQASAAAPAPPAIPMDPRIVAFQKQNADAIPMDPRIVAYQKMIANGGIPAPGGSVGGVPQLGSAPQRPPVMGQLGLRPMLNIAPDAGLTQQTAPLGQPVYNEPASRNVLPGLSPEAQGTTPGAGAADTGTPRNAVASFNALAPRIGADLQRDFNLTREQAAGIVGNLGHESTGFSQMQEQNPVGGGRGGYGWAQWTGPRRVAFENYVQQNGLDPNSYQANYGFLKHELESDQGLAALTGRQTIDAVRSATTAADAMRAFERGFEGAGVKNYASRGRWTQRYLSLVNPPDDNGA